MKKGRQASWFSSEQVKIEESALKEKLHQELVLLFVAIHY